MPITYAVEHPGDPATTLTLSADYARSQFIYAHQQVRMIRIRRTDNQQDVTRQDLGVFFPDDPAYDNILGMLHNGSFLGTLYTSGPLPFREAHAFVVDGLVWLHNDDPCYFIVRWGDYVSFRRQYGDVLLGAERPPSAVAAATTPPTAPYLDLGTVLGDMHDGFPWKTGGTVLRTHITLPFPEGGSTELVQQLLRRAGVEKAYTNKLLVVVGMNDAGQYIAAYSYDDRQFGLVELHARELNRWWQMKCEGRL